MARQLDPQIGAVLKKYGFGPDACWDCHGTWVVYHRVLEQIAAKAGITYTEPTVLVAERDGAAILVTGKLSDKAEWSIGEAVVGTNYKVSGKQAAYPFAMAEKRAKDRVILKLIGLHGLAYSEEEADDFKPTNGEPAHNRGQEFHGPLKITELKEKMRAFAQDLAGVSDDGELAGLLNSYQSVLDQCMRDLPDWWYGKEGTDAHGAQSRIEEMRKNLQQAESQYA